MTATTLKHNYFTRMAKENLELEKTLKKPCHDCAITTGFYMPIADDLLLESDEIQAAVINNWYCHNHTNECCKGAINYIKSMKKQEEDTNE